MHSFLVLCVTRAVPGSTTRGRTSSGASPGIKYEAVNGKDSMTADMTPKAAKSIAERHLKSLGFALNDRAGSGRMQIAAPGVMARVTVRATPVSRSELVKMYESSTSGSSDALAYFAFNGYGKTAVEYANAKKIQLYGIDPSGKVTECNRVGLRPPASTSLSKGIPAPRPFVVHPSRGAIKPSSAVRPPVVPPQSPAIVASKPPSRGPAVGRRAKQWMAGVGFLMLCSVAGGLYIGTSESDPGPAAPIRVVSTTSPAGFAAVPATKTPVQSPFRIQSSSAPETSAYVAPPPVYTPSPTYTPPPVTTTYAPPASPAQSSAYYKNCDAARAAGAAPLYRGGPGYRSKLDRDGDGVACEWS